MKRSINGYILMSMMLLTAYGYSTVEDINDVHDLCRHNRHTDDRYMEENSSYRLNVRSDAKSERNDKLLLRKHKSKCSLTFKLCSSCHMTVLIQNMEIPSCLPDCSCNYFGIREPLSDYTSKKYCGNNISDVIYFESQTKVVHFDFVQSVHKMFYVSLTFNVSSNVYLFTESANSEPRFIETPHFPANYPSDYSADYHFQALGPNGCVQLLFIDFWLSRWSYVEVSGHNGTHSDMYYGDTFRPPPIVSNGPSLSLRFMANDQVPRHGFRVMYTFLQRTDDSIPEEPNTDCGGSKQDETGTFMLAIPESVTDRILFDCIWIIVPPSFTESSHLMAFAISKYDNIAKNSSIEFRSGLTSMSRLVYKCRDLLSCGLDLLNNEVTTMAYSGLYIRFQGRVDKNSSIVIFYYSFHKNNCTAEEFRCRDGKCLNPMLRCDGHHHCIDSADEHNCTKKTNSSIVPEISGSTEEPESPKKEKIVLKGSTEFLVFTVIGSCGFTVIAITILVMIYTRLKVRPTQSEEEETTETENVSVVTYRSYPPCAHRLRMPFRDHPPSYEHVISFNEMYPPLFYTRPINIAETCLNQEILTTTGISECDKEPRQSINGKTWKINDEPLVINLTSTAEENNALGIAFVTKERARSLSVDSGLKKLAKKKRRPRLGRSASTAGGCITAKKQQDVTCSVTTDPNASDYDPRWPTPPKVMVNYRVWGRAPFSNSDYVRYTFRTKIPPNNSGIILSWKNNGLELTPRQDPEV